MSRPVFRSGGRKDLPTIAVLRFIYDQTGEKLAGNQQRGQFGNTQHRFLDRRPERRFMLRCIGTIPKRRLRCLNSYRFIGIVVRRLRLPAIRPPNCQQGFGRRDGLPHPTDLRKDTVRASRQDSLSHLAPTARTAKRKRFVPVVIRLPVTLQKLVVFALETLAGQFRKQVVPLYSGIPANKAPHLYEPLSPSNRS